MKVTALAPWFGSARMNAKSIGEVIGKQAWVGIPFCGGCCEVPQIKARSILLNDRHRHIINLARVVASERSLAILRDRLDKTLFHPDVLYAAREFLSRTASPEASLPGIVDDSLAYAYFVSVWMTRSGQAGTDKEMDGGIASRYTASGGSSVRRYRSAVEGLDEWHRILKDRCEFTCLDWHDFLEKCHDREGHCLYVDPPWVDAGAEYKHKFTEQDHGVLAARLLEFKKCKVVIRHSDHHIYRELYPDWRWIELGGRNQGNNSHSECLIVNESDSTD